LPFLEINYVYRPGQQNIPGVPVFAAATTEQQPHFCRELKKDWKGEGRVETRDDFIMLTRH
jgi:hypothetical protein